MAWHFDAIPGPPMPSVSGVPPCRMNWSQLSGLAYLGVLAEGVSPDFTGNSSLLKHTPSLLRHTRLVSVLVSIVGVANSTPSETQVGVRIESYLWSQLLSR